jgi:alkanesulfonate monooxygenase SsuD/methylene tetrahydromethanopterin reductase-like flavin-dependent oxidoreductase (luciferase family)
MPKSHKPNEVRTVRPVDEPGTAVAGCSRLGILDLVGVTRDKDPANALGATIEIAVLADRLGFQRYWLAEHWGADVITPSPEVLTPVIAGLTNRIRVGPAGILLQFYSPLKVACNALLAEALFPGRTELGLARGGASPDVTRALNGSTSANASCHADKV